jgi:hypothetical protein
MLNGFVAGVSSNTRAALADPEHPWPFANLELRRDGRKIRKRHGIKGAPGDMPARASSWPRGPNSRPFRATEKHGSDLKALSEEGPLVKCSFG